MSTLGRFIHGVRVRWEGYEGTVVENYKMPGDICIDWDNGMKSSYDQLFLIENGVEIIEKDQQ